MTNVNRVKRSLFRAGEMQECLTPTCSQGFEVPAVEIVGPQDGTQDGFDASSEQAQSGVNGVGRARPVELSPLGQQLSQADFQQSGPQAVEGTSSARAQQGPALNIPEAQPYEITGFELQAQGDVAEFAPVRQAAQAPALEPRYVPEVVEPFSLRQHQEVRA